MSRRALIIAVATFALAASGAALATPQAAHAGWVPVGGQLSTQNQFSYGPSIVGINGTPWAAWVENTGPGADPRVATFNGSTWTVRPNPMNNPGPRGAEEIDIANVAGTPYIVFAEGTGPNVPYPEILVKRWNGSAWVAVGGALNLGDTSTVYARGPQIIGFGGRPCVTWWETRPTFPDEPGGNVYVKCFDGSRWGAPIGGAIRTTSAQNAAAPSLAAIGGALHVAWKETLANGAGSVIHVARRTASAWVPVGQPLQTASGNFAGAPDLVGILDVPYLAWQETDTDRGDPGFGASRVYVSRYSGTAWDHGAGAVNDVQYDAQVPRLAAIGGVPHVAYSEADNRGSVAGSQRSVRVARPNQDGTWRTLEGVAPIKKDPQHNGIPGGLTEIGGMPYLAFESGGVWVSRWFISVRNTAPPTISGTPAVGQTLTCNPGTWVNDADDQPLGYQYMWESAARDRDEGEEWPTHTSDREYTVRPEDAGGRVRCRVYAQNRYDNPWVVSASKRTDVAAPANRVPPRVDGNAVTGTEHTCVPGEWTTEGDFTYRWFLGDQAIVYARGRTFVPPRLRSTAAPLPDDYHRLRCEVTVSNDIGPSVPVRSTAIHLVDGVPTNYSPPEVTGDVPAANAVGHELTCRPGVWTDDYVRLGIGGYAYEYQWERNAAAIPGAVGSTYTTTVEDLGTDLSCRVTSANPAGRSASETSLNRRIPLPAVASQGEMLTATGVNEYVPINMMAIGREYKFVVDQYILKKLSDAKNAETTRCQSAYQGADLQRAGEQIGQIDFGRPVDERTRCAVLLLRHGRVSVYSDGVKFMDRCRGVRTNFIGAPIPQECVDLGFALPPVDPSKPPPVDFADQARLAAVTPVMTLWDVDDDGLTDATCPGSAPVMRTMLNRGQWNPRAIIVYPDSTRTGVFSEARAPGPFTNPQLTPGPRGALRDAQPLMCRTSLEQPPDPEVGPCVTDGTIGRVRVTGNLCPISIRTMTQQQIDDIHVNNPALVPVLQQFALNAEKKENLPRSAPPGTVYAAVEPPGLLRPRTVVPDIEAIVAGSLHNHASSMISLTETGLQDPRIEMVAAAETAPVSLPTLKKTAEANFALDQMYISAGAMKVNGVEIDPTESLPGLIIPTEVKDAIDELRGGSPLTSMKILAQEAKTQLVQEANRQLNDFVLSQRKRVEAEIKESANAAVSSLLQSDFVEAVRGYKIGPLSLQGHVDVKLNKDQTATINAQAKVPLLQLTPNGDPIVAKAVLNADREGNIKLESLTLEANRAFLFGIELEGLRMRYDGGLTIEGLVRFGKGAGATIALHYFRISETGRFAGLDVAFEAGAGGGIKVGPGIWLVGLRGGYREAEKRLTAGATFSVGPSTTGGCPAFGLRGVLHVTWKEHVAFNATEDIIAACIPLAKIDFEARSTGYVKLAANVNFREGPLFINGGIGGSFDANDTYLDTGQPKWQLEVNARGGIKKVPIVGDIDAQLQGVLSNAGLAACGRVKFLWEDLAAGAAVDFRNGVPPLSYVQLAEGLRLFTGCDLGKWRVLPSAVGGKRAHAAQAGPGTFSVAGGPRGVALSFQGAGDPPRLRLRSPAGKVYDFTDAVDGKLVDDAYGVMIEDEDRTVVLMRRPTRGRWSAELGEGSPRLVGIERSAVLPKPKVRGRVGGIGSSRVLRYRVRRIAGQQVRLVEEANGAHRELRTVRGGGRGTIRFRTAEATGTRRRILAEVTQDGLPRATIVVARFVAPSPKVGSPRRLRVARRGRTAVVTWRRAALAERYDVIVQAGDGSRSLLAPKGRRLRVTVPGVAKGEGLVVRAVAVSPAGRRGRAARARLKGTLKLGAAKREKPRPRRGKRRRSGRA